MTDKMMMDKAKMAAKKMNWDKEMMTNDEMMMALGETMMGASAMAKMMMDKGMEEKDIMGAMKKMSEMMMDKTMMMEMAMQKQQM